MFYPSCFVLAVFNVFFPLLLRHVIMDTIWRRLYGRFTRLPACQQLTPFTNEDTPSWRAIETKLDVASSHQAGVVVIAKWVIKHVITTEFSTIMIPNNIDLRVIDITHKYMSAMLKTATDWQRHREFATWPEALLSILVNVVHLTASLVAERNR